MQKPLLASSGFGDIDPTRKPITQPKQLIYSAKVDRDKLSCYYKFCRCHCGSEVIDRTFLDVYSNAIHLNVPDAAGCCGYKDKATI